MGLSARTHRRGKALWFELFREQRRVGVYYFYILDPDFGPAFITIATYFPYPARVWVNGHEWAKRQAQHAGIAYRALSNGFASTPEPERLQAICDSLQPGHIQAFFDISNADLRRPSIPPSNRTARPRADGDGGWVKSTYEPYTQFYSAAISPQDVSRVSGGTQDNGSLRSWGGPDWNEYVGGDGEENLINPRNSQNVFACYQYGNCFRSVDGGDTNQYFADRVVGDRANWFTPVQFDPSDPDVMYYGSNVLNRSTDNGLTWTAISPDVTGGPGQDAYPFGTITTVAAAQSDSRTIYFGTDDGRIWVTRDLGASWTLAYSGTAWITRVAVDPVDAATVYATRSGYRSGSYQPHVLVSHDSGGSWTDLSGNLPQAPVNDVVLGRGRTVYVATDQGVFVSRSGLDRWQRMGRGLPLVPVDDIEYDAGHRRLVAATFGRSMYEIDAP